MPLTTITMTIATIVMLGSWLFIERRLTDSPAGGPRQAHLLAGFFLNMGIFSGFIALPHFLLNDPSLNFPLAIAVGYVIGHIFFYLAMIYLVRLTCSIVPRLNNKSALAATVIAIAATFITIFNAITMIWGTRPYFDAEHGVTIFGAHPVVGVGIALIALAGMLPLTILMIMNGFTNPTSRTRSFLLGGGLALITIAGPMHDIAPSAMVYMIADVVSVVGLLVVASGVAYRIEEKISVRHAPVRA